jgi:hypothetical protein
VPPAPPPSPQSPRPPVMGRRHARGVGARHSGRTLTIILGYRSQPHTRSAHQRRRTGGGGQPGVALGLPHSADKTQRPGVATAGHHTLGSDGHKLLSGGASCGQQFGGALRFNSHVAERAATAHRA